MCHKYTPVLRELVRRIGADNDIYLHVDAKAGMEDFEPLRESVNFLDNRVGVVWGCYSQIEATLRLLDATRARECDYIALVSGDTLPLRTDSDIKRYLWENRGREFIYELPLARGHEDRLRYRYPDVDPRRSKWTALRRRSGLLPRNNYFGSLPPLHFGSNWFVITPALRDWMFDYLGMHPEYTEAFRHSRCGDELFFITLAACSPFAKNLDPRRYMYVDWTTGPQKPRTLDATDLERLRDAAAKDTPREHYLFARKFADDMDLNSYREYLEL